MEPTLATRNNNPGNLKDPASGQFRNFASPQEGYSALLNDLEAKKTGKSKSGLTPKSTLADFANVYAPPSDKNNSAQYTANLANAMKVAPNTPLSELDVGSWANAVAKAEGYQPQQSNSPFQTPQAHAQGVGAPTPPPPPQQTPDLLDKATNIATAIFPGKQIGESLTTVAGNLNKLVHGNTNFEQVNIPKLIGDYAQGFAFVGAPGVGGLAGKGVVPALSRVAAMSGLGAVSGGGAGLAQTGDISGLKSGAESGALIGGVLGTAGEGISKLAGYLPFRFARAYLPGTNPATVNYAIDKGLGTPASMLKESTANLTKVGSGIDDVLNNPAFKDTKFTYQDIFPQISTKYPNAGLDNSAITDYLKKRVPLQSALVDKLSGPTDQEVNRFAELTQNNLGGFEGDSSAFATGNVLKPEAAQGRISDVAQKLDLAFPGRGYGSQFKKLVSVNDVYLENGGYPNLMQAAQQVIQKGGGLTAKELNTLKTALGRDTFKMRFDDPTVKAGKDIGSTTYHAINDTLKDASKKLLGSDKLSPAFDEYTKELQLNGALAKAQRSLEKGRPLTLRDIVAALAGFGAGGPLGAIGTYALEKALVSPNINLPVAGAISKLAKPAAGLIGKYLVSSTARGAVNNSKP